MRACKIEKYQACICWILETPCLFLRLCPGTVVFLVSGVKGKVRQTCVSGSLDWRLKRPIKRIEAHGSADYRLERQGPGSRRREDQKCISKNKTSVNCAKS